jgi:tetratricopeptide (TPR) repeat protein
MHQAVAKWSKIIVFILFLVFYSTLITFKIILPAAEDLPRQMRNGYDILHGDFEVIYKNVYSFTQPEHEFANHHWLYGVYSHVLHSVAGYDGIVLAKVVILLIAFCLLFLVALRKANFWLVLVFAFPTVILLASRAAARPEMFSYLFVAMFLYLLTDLDDNPTNKKVYGVIPLQLLWANLHIMFPMGVALVGSYWFAAILKSPKTAFKSPLVRKLTLVLVLTCAVSMANPWGITGVIYSLGANTVNEAQIFSSEVQSIASVFRTEPKSDYPAAVMFPWLLTMLAVSFVLAYKQKPVFYFLLSLATALLSFSIIRGLPLFGMIFLPAIASNLAEPVARATRWLQARWPNLQRAWIYAAPVLSIIFLIYATFVIRPQLFPYQIPGIGITSSSEEPVNFIKEHGLRGPILNDTDSGSYLTHYLYPDEKIFADNRFSDAYSNQFLEEEYLGLFVDEEVWKKMNEKYGFNMIFLNHYNQGGGVSDFIYRRIYDPEWAWVYAGRDDLIFIRRLPEYQALIEIYGITRDNIHLKLNDLSQAPDFPGQVAAADIFGLAGMVREARFEYEKVLSRWPHMGRVWFVIGRLELQRADQENADVALALLALQRAIEEGYRTPNSYSFLVLAHYRLGQLDEAEAALKKELQLDPKSEDAAEWKRILTEARLAEESEEAE